MERSSSRLHPKKCKRKIASLRLAYTRKRARNDKRKGFSSSFEMLIFAVSLLNSYDLKIIHDNYLDSVKVIL
ncbi:MAG: hypothetical protein AUJ99_02095 [Caldisericum sp. CG2_30_36_11]|nr:MAG: hypothetical protein AUJ99_02095 [Caldisericum sp. CG2_30_36_11]